MGIFLQCLMLTKTKSDCLISSNGPSRDELSRWSKIRPFKGGGLALGFRLGPSIVCCWCTSPFTDDRLSCIGGNRPQQEACLKSNPGSGGQGGARDSAFITSPHGMESSGSRGLCWLPTAPGHPAGLLFLHLCHSPAPLGHRHPVPGASESGGMKGQGRRVTFPQGLRFDRVGPKASTDFLVGRVRLP